MVWRFFFLCSWCQCTWYICGPVCLCLNLWRLAEDVEDFDSVVLSTEKLNHPTATRPRVMDRRPRSQIFTSVSPQILFLYFYKFNGFLKKISLYIQQALEVSETLERHRGPMLNWHKILVENEKWVWRQNPKLAFWQTLEIGPPLKFWFLNTMT